MPFVGEILLGYKVVKVRTFTMADLLEGGSVRYGINAVAAGLLDLFKTAS